MSKIQGHLMFSKDGRRVDEREREKYSETEEEDKQNTLDFLLLLRITQPSPCLSVTAYKE